MPKPSTPPGQKANKAPTSITLSNSSIAENNKGATIGVIKVNDPDKDDTATLSVGDSRFEIVTNAQGQTVLRLKDGISLDYESSSAITINVTATDSAGNTLTKALVLTVTNVNEAPSVTASVPSATLVEATPTSAGTTTAVVSLTPADPDGTSPSYVLTGWTLQADGTYWKDGTYGSAILNTSTHRLTYTLDNTRTATDSLTGKDQVADDFTIGVTDGSLSGGTKVSFSVKGKNDVPPWQPEAADSIVYAHFGGASIISVAQDGTLTDAGIGLPNPAFASYDVVAADVDGDGYQDVLVTGDNTFGRLYYNNGDGTFSDSGQLFPGTTQNWVSAGDIDNDNDLDVFFFNSRAGEVSTLYQNNEGTFTPIFETSLHQALFGDLNGDGYQDIYLTNPGQKILFSDGTGQFIDSGIAIAGIGNARDTQLGDVNNDGYLDIVRAPVRGSTDGVLVNDGTGNFSVAQSSFGPTSGGRLALADIDGNGTLDAVTASGPVNGGLQWWSNDGDGHFSFAATINANAYPYLSIADFNGDGHADIATLIDGLGVTTLMNDGRGQFSIGGYLDVPAATFDTGLLLL